MLLPYLDIASIYWPDHVYVCFLNGVLLSAEVPCM